jgi:hypothetical protein
MSTAITQCKQSLHGWFLWLLGGLGDKDTFVLVTLPVCVNVRFATACHPFDEDDSHDDSESHRNGGGYYELDKGFHLVKPPLLLMPMSISMSVTGT